MARRAATVGSARRRPRLDVFVLVLAVLGAVPAFGTSQLLGGLAAEWTLGGAASPGPEPGGGPGAQTSPPAATPHVDPNATPEPTAPSGSGLTVHVTTIEGLLRALADNAVGAIVVADGVYHVSPSNEERSDSLWIGSPYASRTRPVTVRAETPGGVVFDGGGEVGYGGLSFEDGAHDQTWDGFVFANMAAEQSGIVEIGGYVARRTPHHITLRNITILGTCTGSATSADAPAVDHAFYISNARVVGPHDLLFEDITVDGSGGLASAFHFDHGTAADPNATGVVVRRLHVTGTQQALILWQPPLHDITFDQVDISGALSHAIRFESIGATDIVFSNITSTGSGNEPFFSMLGAHPPGVTLTDDSLR